MQHQTLDPQTTLLVELPVGVHARIAGVQGGKALARRLMGLGLRVGSKIVVVQRRGRGTVVTSAETRIALGGSLTGNILVDQITAGDE